MLVPFDWDAVFGSIVLRRLVLNAVLNAGNPDATRCGRRSGLDDGRRTLTLYFLYAVFGDGFKTICFELETRQYGCRALWTPYQCGHHAPKPNHRAALSLQIIVNDALNGAFEQWRCLLAQSISLTGFLARKDVLKLLDSFRGSPVKHWKGRLNISMAPAQG